MLSVAGVAAAGGAVAVAAQGGRWPLAAAALVVLAGVLDGLDGAVALHTGRARPLGAVVDAVADRLGDLLLVATLAVPRCPAGLVRRGRGAHDAARVPAGPRRRRGDAGSRAR